MYLCALKNPSVAQVKSMLTNRRHQRRSDKYDLTSANLTSCFINWQVIQPLLIRKNETVQKYPRFIHCTGNSEIHWIVT